MRENLASQGSLTAARRRPLPPRNLAVTWTSPHFNLSWSAPQNLNGVLGFNIYRGNDNTRILNINNPQTVFAEIQMPTGTVGFFGLWVSCYTSLFESIKIPIVGHAT